MSLVQFRVHYKFNIYFEEIGLCCVKPEDWDVLCWGNSVIGWMSTLKKVRKK